MSDAALIHLCILWEGELRQAAKLLQAAMDAEESDAARPEKFSTALLAAHVALKGLTDDKAVCMIGSDQIRKRVKFKRT